MGTDKATNLSPNDIEPHHILIKKSREAIFAHGLLIRSALISFLNTNSHNPDMFPLHEYERD